MGAAGFSECVWMLVRRVQSNAVLNLPTIRGKLSQAQRKQCLHRPVETLAFIGWRSLPALGEMKVLHLECYI